MLACASNFLTRFPPELNTYDFGGISACTSGFISSFLAFLFYLSHVFYFYEFARPQSIRHRQYELAFSVFVWSIIFGGLLFTFLEDWDYDRAIQYTLSTLLTIGYGDLAPKTVAGRIITIFYFLVVFLVVKYFFVSFEDIVIDETVKHLEALEPDAILTNDGSVIGTGDAFEVPLENLTPIPLAQFQTNVSFHEQPKPTIWQILYMKLPEITLIFSWWFVFSAIFAHFEGWSYIDGNYYVFSTYATIGFGDLVLRHTTSREFWYVFVFNKVFCVN